MDYPSLLAIAAIGIAGAALFTAQQHKRPAHSCGHGLNVMDFGAKGDGVTDDTAAIQAAINAACQRRGGTVFFPYTENGYRVAAAAHDTIDGKPCRGQLYIPAGPFNIQLKGEHPCKLLYSYQVRPKNTSAVFKPTVFGTMTQNNTMIFSDWLPPEEHDPNARPWSILSTIEGTSCAGKFSVNQVSIANLEFRVKLDKDAMYPRQSAVNLQNAARMNIQDSQFCLDDNVGDTELGKALQPNPNHTVGLMGPGDQNDNVVIRNAAVQGFRYGYVLGEHVVADYLYVHNCEEAVVFHDCSHLSMIHHIVAQHDQKIITTTRGTLFGHKPGQCFVQIDTVDIEGGHGIEPVVSQMTHGVFDPDNRLHGSVTWHVPWGKKEFAVEGGAHFKTTPFSN